MQVNAQFDGALNAQSAPDKVGQNEVVAASNVDFSLVPGALVSRRGSRPYLSLGTSAITNISRTYNNNVDFGSSPWYISTNLGVWRALGQVTPTQIVNGSHGGVTVFRPYNEETLIAHGASSQYYKDDGTRVAEWVLQAPSSAPTVTIQASPALSLGTAFTVAEGTGTSTLGTATATGSGRIVLEVVPSSTNLADNSGTAIGDEAIDYLDISFSNPSVVTKVSRDYSIGDTSFNSYFHAEIHQDETVDTMATGQELAESAPLDADTDIATREGMLSELKLNYRTPVTKLPTAPNTFAVWAVARPQFELVTKESAPAGWSNIPKLRIIVECSEEVVVRVRSWEVRGSEGYPLHDASVGFTWYETWATLDADGNVLDESAPGPPSLRTKCQHARAALSMASAPTGTLHNITHRRLWREGGYLRDAYLVGQVAIGTSAYTDATSDMSAIGSRQRLTRNIHSRTSMPGNVVAISEPYYSRVVVGHGNQIMWSEPGLPSVFKKTSITNVSNKGDEVYALITWMPSIVIVNRDSIYEFSGSVFDGAEQDWMLFKSGSRRGSKAPRTIIRTPYGIPILDYDGLYMYMPGQGNDQRLDWLDGKIGDAFRGEQSYDPAALSGSRVPPINKGYIFSSFAMWYGSKLLLGVPTGSSQSPNTLFIIDFPTQRVWHYTYPFTMTSGWVDATNNTVYVGTTDGKVMEIETNTNDSTTAGDATPITWSARLRTWTWPNTARLTNLSVDADSPLTIHSVLDGTSTSTTSLTSTTRKRVMPTLLGSQANTLQFTVTGTNTSSTSRQTLYGIDWDAYEEPPSELYHRTEYFTAEREQTFLQVTSELDPLSGTVSGTMFVEGAPIVGGTFTYTGTVGPQGYRRYLTTPHVGRVVFVEYRSTTPFRHYRTSYITQDEPPLTTYWKTDIHIPGGEVEWKALANQLDVNGGTCTGSLFVDASLISTYTYTGTGQQGYVKPIPSTPNPAPLNHTYGRSAYVIYTSSTPFRHYSTWYETLPEPSRVTHFRTPTLILTDEYEFDTINCELNCLSNTVTGVTHVDGTAIATHTFTGAGYKGYVQSLPPSTYGRSIYTIFTSPSVFKPYNVEWSRRPEPPRITSYRTPTKSYPFPARLKTLILSLNCYSGTVSWSIRRNGEEGQSTVLASGTVTGHGRQSYNIGLDVNSNLTRVPPESDIDVLLTAVSGSFKYYSCELDVEPTPFSKRTWQVSYRKIGGATAIDQARKWSMDVEAPAGGTGAVFTSVWTVDDVATHTSTHTIAAGRYWLNDLPLPPTIRGWLFEQRLYSSDPIQVWSSTLDIQRQGVKGYSRLSVAGVPS